MLNLRTRVPREMTFLHRHSVAQFEGLVSIKISPGGCIGVSGVKMASQVAFGFQGSNLVLEDILFVIQSKHTQCQVH